MPLLQNDMPQSAMGYKPQAEMGNPGQDKAMPGNAQAGEEAMTNGSSNPNEPQPNVSPEEQALYTSVVVNAMRVIYGDGSDQVLNILHKAGTPAEGVAQAANTIGDQILKAAQKQGKTIPDDVLNAASDEVIHLLFELGKKAGVFNDISDDQQFAAKTRLLQLWDKTHPGMMDQNAMQESMKQIDKTKIDDIMRRMSGQPANDATGGENGVIEQNGT